MGKRGPAPGSGGRPRTQSPKPRPDGYKRTTVGPLSAGTTQYEHRVVAAGGKPGGSKLAPRSSKSALTGIVDHRDGNKSNAAKSNLHRVTKAQNNRKG